MFPGPGAQIIRNEAGEPLGWDYPSDDANAFYCDTCGFSHAGPCPDDFEPEADPPNCCKLGDWKGVRFNAFGQKVRSDAPELPGDEHWMVCEYCDSKVKEYDPEES